METTQSGGTSVDATVGVEAGLAVVAGDSGEGPLSSFPVLAGGGVVCWIDPLEVDRFVKVTVEALDEDAPYVLAELLGASAGAVAARAANTTVWGESFEPKQVTLDRSSPAWKKLSRLGFLLWLEEYSILPIDQRDADIEVALVASELGALTGFGLADERFERSADHLIARVEELVSGSLVTRAEPQLVLTSALRKYVADHASHLDAGDRRYVTELSARADTMVAEGAAPIPLSIPWETVLRGDLALAAGSSHAPASTVRRDSVDVRRVPRNALLDDELTVVSVLDPTEGRITVHVAAAPTAHHRRAETLMFALVSEGDRRARVAAPLTYDSATDRYTGSCPLPSPVNDSDFIDVYSVLSEIEPAFGAQRDLLAGTREATRAFLTERLPNQDGEFDSTPLRLGVTQQRWELAASHFTSFDADSWRARVAGERAEGLRSIDEGADASLWISRLPALALAETTYFESVEPQS